MVDMAYRIFLIKPTKKEKKKLIFYFVLHTYEILYMIPVYSSLIILAQKFLLKIRLVHIYFFISPV